MLIDLGKAESIPLTMGKQKGILCSPHNLSKEHSEFKTAEKSTAGEASIVSLSFWQFTNNKKIESIIEINKSQH